MAAVVGLLYEEQGTFGIFFPDFPNLIGGAASLDETLSRARVGLVAHVEILAQLGQPLPELRGIDQIRADPSLAEELEGAAFVILDVDLPGKVVRLNITMDDRLLSQVDRAAKALGESRSAFLATAARERLKATAR